jgi:phage terminase Nu1 subunit (DNA packaging protein)
LKQARSSNKLKGGKHYKLADSVRRYLEYQRGCVTQQLKADQSDYTIARARRMAALGRVEEMRARQLSGELVRRDRVLFVMTNLLSVVKNHMLGIPSRVMHRLAGKNAFEAN